MRQRSLFDNASRHRKTDPSTSAAAVADMNVKLNQAQQHMADVLMSTLNPMTAQEAAAECAALHGGMAETYRKRIGEIEAIGRVRKVGVKVCEITGKRAAAYRGA